MFRCKHDGSRLRVVDSRMVGTAEGLSYTRRRYRCKLCGFRLTTCELATDIKAGAHILGKFVGVVRNISGVVRECYLALQEVQDKLGSLGALAVDDYPDVPVVSRYPLLYSREWVSEHLHLTLDQIGECAGGATREYVRQRLAALGLRKPKGGKICGKSS